MAQQVHELQGSPVKLNIKHVCWALKKIISVLMSNLGFKIIIFIFGCQRFSNTQCSS